MLDGKLGVRAPYRLFGSTPAADMFPCSWLLDLYGPSQIISGKDAAGQLLEGRIKSYISAGHINRVITSF